MQMKDIYVWNDELRVLRDIPVFYAYKNMMEQKNPGYSLVNPSIYSMTLTVFRCLVASVGADMSLILLIELSFLQGTSYLSV